MSFEWLHSQTPTIIYVGDPMCSWCYGFAPAMTEVKEALPNYELKLVMGGLRPHGTETNAELGDFLRHHWKDVEKRTDQPFSYEILDDKSVVYDTEPACRSVIVARMMNPAIEFDFFKDVQSAFYVHNKDMRSAETYIELAEKHGLNTTEYEQLFLSEEVKYETNADFQLSKEMGISGFPSVIVRHGDQLFLASNGYREAKDLLKIIEQIEAEPTSE